MTGVGIGDLFAFDNRVLVNVKLCFIILVFFLTILPGTKSFGQDYPAYDEIALFLDVPDLGGRDIDVLIMGNEVFLPITDLFDFLMIKNIPTPGLDTISGFFINQDATYLIDRVNNQIQYGDQIYKLDDGDLIRTETNLFLRGKYFGQIFGLECHFYFRSMSVRVNTKFELPAIREMRLQAMRKNINRLVGEEEADTTIGRVYPFFHFGMADWSANLIEQPNGKSNSRLGLSIGSILAGGEATVSLNYNSYSPFTEKQQYYLWRYVNNDNKALRQVMAGKISTGATSSIFDPVVGAKITNASTKFKRSFGSYTLSDHTKPNWIVELYVNNVLVDYTTADASGFFTFEVPLVYGNTNVMLKFYGPYGEEQIREQNITIPFNFVPKKTLEYSVSGGMVEDNQHSKFSKSSVHYGLSRAITIGSGVEYLSSVTSGQVMPFVNGSFRLASNLLLSGEFSPEVRSKGTLTYRLPSNLQFDINYTRYTKGQTAIFNNYREERKFSMSLPIRVTNFSVYNRFSINQLVLPLTNYTTSEWLISGSLFGVGTNITSYGVFVGNAAPYFYSDFSASFRIPKDISIQPRVQYSYSNKEFLSAKILAEKRVLKKGHLTASYEQNLRLNLQIVEFGFRYDFKFAQTSFNARVTDRTTNFIQYARGSIVNDSKTNYVYTDNRPNVGRGGISIIPFLDKNGNGTRDPGEPKVYGLNLRASNGRIEKREIDTTIRIFGLEAYTDCYVEFDQSSLDNIAWRLKHRSMNIAVDPNLIKLVEIPILVVGEAAGMIRIDREGILRGIGRVIVNIYDKNNKKVGRTLSEEDGYFSYFGLQAGTYEARIDSAQLRKINMIATPDSVGFYIRAILDGDYVDGIDFVLRMDTAQQTEVHDVTDMIVYKETEIEVNDTIDSFAIEFGEFSNETQANIFKREISSLLGKEAELIFDNDKIKVCLTGFENRDQVKDYYPILQRKGIKGISLVKFNGIIEPRLIAIVPGTETDSVKTQIGDTMSVLVVHKLIVEDTTSISERFTILTRTFTNEAEANTIKDQINTLPGLEATLILDNGIYKVSITGFNSGKEVVASYPILQSLGISEIGLITTQELLNTVVEAQLPVIATTTVKPHLEKDSTIVVIHHLVEEDSRSSKDSYAVQLGAFKHKINADNLRNKLADLLDKEIIITHEDDYYKVRLVGFTSNYEVERYIPSLVRKGFREVWIITLKGTLKPDLVAGEPDIHRDVLDTITKNGPTYLIVHDVYEDILTTGPGSYTIQLGMFNRKINADALRARLTTILGKDVKIFVEDDLYKVRIIGFETRREAEIYISVLQKEGIRDVLILPLPGKHDYKIAVSKLDTVSASYKKVIGVDTLPVIDLKPTIKEISEPISDTSRVVNQSVLTEKKEEDIPSKLSTEKATEETRVTETNVATDLEETNSELEHRKTLEERLIEAEYRSGLYKSRWPGVEFTIQIAASKTLSDPEVIKNKYDLSADVEVEKSDEWYRFTAGHFIKFWKAREYRNFLNTRNALNDAFIVAYQDGKRVMLYDLLAMVDTMPDDNTGINVRTSMSKCFSVQILATKDGNISDSEIRRKYNIDEDIFKEYDESDGLYRYTIGNFNTYTGAVKVRNKIRANGYRDAFVVGYKYGNRLQNIQSILND